MTNNKRKRCEKEKEKDSDKRNLEINLFARPIKMKRIQTNNFICRLYTRRLQTCQESYQD